MNRITSIQQNLASIREVGMVLRNDDSVDLPAMAKVLDDRCTDIELELHGYEDSIDFEDLRQLIMQIE